MNEQRNLILAAVLSVAILFGFDFFFGTLTPTPPAPEAQSTAQTGGAPTVGAPTTGTPALPGDALPVVPGSTPDVDAAVAQAQARAIVLTQSPRIIIENLRLDGSISLKGGRIDDISLRNYKETLDEDSPDISLLNPRGDANAFYAEFGWAANGVTLPDAETLWAATGNRLAPGQPVTLTWDNGQGLTFARTYAIDDNYLFTVTQSVKNSGAAPVTMFPYGLISRTNTPEVSGLIILHEGPLGVFDGTLKEIDYDDLQDEKTIEETGTNWAGITDKYWLTALIPSEKVKTRYTHRLINNIDKYQVDYLGAAVNVAPGATSTVTSKLFAGAKEVKVLDGYAENLKIEGMDRAIDFGAFYFLTKPIFYLLIFINDYIGNFGVAILALTVLIKALMFPLANKSYTAMSKMKKLQPQINQMRERIGDDKQRLNQEMMALYKKEKANPAAGCLPLVVQIPVFFALYKVLYVNIEMRHAPFFGWIHDLSAPDPMVIFNLFGLIPWDPPSFLAIGIWPVIMGITMFLQQKLNPQPADPVQAKIFMFLPFIFTFLLGTFASGLVIYWAWNNSLSILQQWVIMRRMGVR